ncbi:MAG: methionine aminotransferase, partial [Lysobacterales bacterium]
REAIARKIVRCYGVTVDPANEVTVTSGATEAIFAAIAAVISRGDEVIVLDPCYDCYEPAIELAGGRAVHVPLRAPDFAIDWQHVAEAVTPRTRLIMINSPHNPTGAVIGRADLDALASLAERHDLLVLSDEVYEHIIFDGVAHASALTHETLAARTFVISSFGKTYHCTGWKVGYCIAPAALTVEFRKVHQYLTFCTFTPAQFAFAEVLDTLPQHDQELPAFYASKRDRFRALLAQSRFSLTPVAGGYFQLADYSAISDLGDREVCEWLTREVGVAAIPLSAFYSQAPAEQRLIRFCFAKTDATLEAAAAKLCAI